MEELVGLGSKSLQSEKSYELFRLRRTCRRRNKGGRGGFANVNNANPQNNPKMKNPPFFQSGLLPKYFPLFLVVGFGFFSQGILDDS
jgi:hypothetical protein